MREHFASPVDRLVFPLDVASLDDARTWIRRLRGEVGVFKVGLELFTAVGPKAVEVVHEAGARCFLDLKLHDIPATMAGAVRSACGLGVAYLTVHGGAGPAALRACADAAATGSTRVLAVTVLTSMDADELSAVGVSASPRDHVVHLARIAGEAGVRGLVCSPEECEPLRAALGDSVTLMVPGVRPSGADVGDQKRVATPAVALARGADLLVVGRPIRHATDPVAAARAIVAEMAGVR